MSADKPDMPTSCTWCRGSTLRKIPATLAAFAGLALTCQAATLIQNFTAASNDRFANDPAFIGSAFDWSGVGRSTDGHWGTMLSPTVFLSANHYHPGVGSSMVFFPGNDPGASPITRTVTSGQAIGSSDLWIGVLGAALPATITSYDFAQVATSAAGFATSALNNLECFMGGITPTASGYGAVTTTVQTVGENRLEGFFDDLTVYGSTGDVLVTVQNLTGDAAYGFTLTGFEAQLQIGDSGSPLMLVADGKLVLAGIAWAVGPVDIDDNPTITVERQASAFTYTGSHTTELLAFIPEPGADLLALAGGVLFAMRRRRGVGPGRDYFPNGPAGAR